MEPIYERKISSEESKNGYFLVLKNKLLCFPSIGSPFSVKVGRREKKAAVESYHCECRGPERPHEHYFVRWPGLVKGTGLSFEKAQRERISIPSELKSETRCGEVSSMMHRG
jgi:hypothetical protein